MILDYAPCVIVPDEARFAFDDCGCVGEDILRGDYEELTIPPVYEEVVAERIHRHMRRVRVSERKARKH